MNFLPGWGAGLLQPNKAQLEFRAHYVDPADLTVYTFAASDLGAPHASRHVIVAVCTRTGSPTDVTFSMTIGGVAATQVATLTTTQATNRNRIALFIAAVPTGATGDIVVTVSGATLRCGIAVWAAYNLASATPIATATSSDLASQSLNINTLADSVAVGFSFANNATQVDWSWTGLTEDAETTVETTLDQSSGTATLALAETPRTITASLNALSVGLGLAASFR